MLTGMSLTELAAELDRQNEAKQDWVVPEQQIVMLPGGEEDSRPSLHLPNGDDYAIKADAVARRQIGDHLHIPAKFWDHLEDGHQALLAHNVSTLFKERKDPRRMMVRTFDFQDTGARYARAFLSDRYLRRDNQQVMEAALAALLEVPGTGEWMQKHQTGFVSDRACHLTAVAPRIQGEVKRGDVVQAGVRIRNSEVGWGALVVEPFVYRLICENGMVGTEVTRLFRLIHSGPQVDSDDTLRVLSNETLRKDDEAFFAKLKDVIKAAVDETLFNDIVLRMREATQTAEMAKPETAMEQLGQRFKLGEGEQESILHHLIKGGDLTAYGALNAVTRAAQDVESYERGLELEEVGGKILAMAGTKDWERVATAA